MEKTKSPTKGFAILSAAGIINKILSVAYLPLLIQIIGSLGYGIYSAGYKIYAFIYILTNSGFPIGISKLQAELIAHENYRDARRSFRIIRFVMTLYGLFMAVLTALLARQLTGAIHSERAYLVILALSPTMLFTAVSSTYRGYFNGNSNMKPTAVSQIIEQFLNVVFSLTFAVIFMPYGVEWGCAGATVGTTLGALSSALYLKHTYNRSAHMLHRKTSEDIGRLSYSAIIKKFLFYAVPIAINSVVVFGGDLVDLANTQSRLLASGFSAKDAYIKYGLLNKYSSLLNVPLAITSALYIAVMPSFSAALALNDTKRLKYNINEAFRISLSISIPAATGLTILSKPIFLMLFSRYSDGWYLMAYGAVVVILFSIVQIQAGILQSVNKTQLSTFSMLIGIFIKIFINYYLISIPSLNVMGAVIGTIVCFIIVIYLNRIFIKKHLPIMVSFKRHMGRPAISSAVMALTAGITYKLFYMILGFIKSPYLINAISTILAVIIGISSYVIVMIKVGGLSLDDLNTLPHSRSIKKFIPPFILSMVKDQK